MTQIERVAYTLTEASQLLGGISRGTFYNMWARGEIRLVKVAGRTLVPRTEIERLTTPKRESTPKEPTR